MRGDPLPIADCRLPISNFQFPIADCRLPIADFLVVSRRLKICSW